MGLAAHQEEIIAQLYREMYRKLVVYAENALNDSLAEEAVQVRSELHARNTTNS